MFKKWLFLFSLALTLSGCVMTNPAPEISNQQKIAWPERQRQLGSIHQWIVKGGLAVKENDKGFSAHLLWHQKGRQHYTLNIVGPIGAGSAMVTGKPGDITLKTNDGKTFEASSAAALIQQALGWRIPVENLYYWIRGLPAKAGVAAKTFDAYQHIQTLKQQGWTVSYLQYTRVQGKDLPAKIVLTAAGLKIKIIVSSWHI